MTDEQDDFDRFWALWPRKIAKKAARKAWDKAVKDDTVLDIMSGVHEYIKNLPEQEKFIPHPATWLSQGRYFDEKFEKKEHVTPRPTTARIKGLDWADTIMRGEWGKKAIDSSVVNDMSIWAERNPGEYPDQMLLDRFIKDRNATREKVIEAKRLGSVYYNAILSYYKAFRAREERITRIYSGEGCVQKEPF